MNEKILFILTIFSIIISLTYIRAFFNKSTALAVFTTVYLMPGIVLAINAINDNIKFSYWTPELQIQEISLIGVTITTVGLIGFLLGHYFPINSNLMRRKMRTIQKFSIIEFCFWGFVSLFFIWHAMPKAMVTEAAYATVQYSTFGNIAVYNITGNLIIFILFINAMNRKSKIRLFYVGILYLIGIVYFQFLAGHRVEGLGLTLSIVFYWLFVTSNEDMKMYFDKLNIFTKVKYKYTKIRTVLLYIFLVVVIILLWGMGAWRSSASSGISFYESAKYAFSSFATFGDAAQTLSLSIAIVKKGILLYGKTYLDYILSTFPTSITPNRPEHMSWQLYHLGTQIGHQGMGGGIYLPATGYINFGLLGTFIEMFLIGMIISSIEKNAKLSETKYISLGQVSYGLIYINIFRWNYYGGQSAYKLVLVFIIMIFFMKILHEFLIVSLKGKDNV
jgi:hypothetical protein